MEGTCGLWTNNVVAVELPSHCTAKKIVQNTFITWQRLWRLIDYYGYII